MTLFEVDLRDRKTGNSIFTIARTDDHELAYGIAENINNRAIENYDKEMSGDDYIDGTVGIVADVYIA